MKSGLGIMCVPPSHQPPVPMVAAFFIRLPSEEEGSSRNSGTFTAPAVGSVGV
jgi:hypothetical protein